MIYKWFIVLCVAAPIVMAPPMLPQATVLEQDFAAKFNSWATLGNHNGDIVDAREIRAWHETNHAWNKLKSFMDATYK